MGFSKMTFRTLLILVSITATYSRRYKKVSSCASVTPSLPQNNIEDLTPGKIRVAAFNIKSFGRAKMSKPKVACRIVEILHLYDVVLIQEVRDSSGKALDDLWRLLNATGAQWGMARSARLGRSRYKEQYVYVYRTDRAQLTGTYQVPDPRDGYEREPYCAEFSYPPGAATARRVALVALHAKPTDAPAELALLARDVISVSQQFQGASGVLALGDFNADCSYATADERAALDIFKTDSGFVSLIPDSADTTTSDTHCAYDRIVSHGSPAICAAATVFDFEAAMRLSASDGYAISDHYPVAVTLC